MSKRRSYKLVDTSVSVSAGGRCDRYWTPVKFDAEFAKYIPHLANEHELRRMIFTSDISAVLKRYHIAALEFGNWVNQNLRHNFFAALVFSLEDINRILGFKDNIGFDRLSIAYGARGSGSARAHFEASNDIVNMTKIHGMGSFAHEYGHYIDFFVGLNLQPSSVHDALSGGRAIETQPANPYKKGSARYLMCKLLHKLTYQENGHFTKYYTRISEMSIYWYRRTEMFARLFEQWVAYRLNRDNKNNYFLAKPKYQYQGRAYLSDSELARVLPEMEALMKEIKRMILE